MNTRDTGGPAFPWNGEMDSDLNERSGMTLRDYFAAKAMQGLIVGRAAYMKEWAEEAYRAADAMLSEREK